MKNIFDAIEVSIDRDLASIREGTAPELKVTDGWITVDGSGVYFRVEDIVRVRLNTGDELEGSVPSNGYFLMNIDAMRTRKKD